MLLFCKAILKYLLYQLGTGEINKMKKKGIVVGGTINDVRNCGYTRMEE